MLLTSEVLTGKLRIAWRYAQAFVFHVNIRLARVISFCDLDEVSALLKEAAMLKGSGFLFLIPCAMMLGLWGLSAVPSDLDCPEASEKLARRLQSRRLFAAFLERTLADLSQGTLTLRQASAALLAYSRAFHKDYLVNMHWAEEGATQLEMVARNCVRHFRWNIECEDLYEASAVLERLERQLDQIISDEASGTEALAPQQPAQGPGPLLQSKNGSRTQAAVAPEGRGACFM